MKYYWKLNRTVLHDNKLKKTFNYTQIRCMDYNRTTICVCYKKFEEKKGNQVCIAAYEIIMLGKRNPAKLRKYNVPKEKKTVPNACCEAC